VLRRSEPLERLLDAVRRADRLVLLGDLIELRHSRLHTALAAATPVLKALGEAVNEIVIVPGNHDHHLLAAWFERRALEPNPAPLSLNTAVAWQPDDFLGRVVEALQPAAVTVKYPGIWLRDDVYATHGHYLDRHTTVPLIERIGAGVMARVLREPSEGPHTIDDYERTLQPIYAWIHALAQSGAHDIGDSRLDPSMRGWRVLTGSNGARTWRERAVVTAFPPVVAAMNKAGIGPLKPDLSGPQLRRAALTAFTQVIERLGIKAAHVIFGHTHRAGPLPADDRAEWQTPNGLQIINCGSWVDQPDFLGPDPAASPYRAGFGVELAGDGPPELVNLLSSRPGVKQTA
jgi:Calcineurin-like phosphoesterase